MILRKVHHVAVICSDYERSKHFYCDLLGLRLLAEHYRAERRSWKADLALGEDYVLELFSFPSPPPRPSYPEAAGLRHLAFEVDDIHEAKTCLEARHIACGPVRTDEYTGKRFLFFADPDDLPLELYEK